MTSRFLEFFCVEPSSRMRATAGCRIKLWGTILLELSEARAARGDRFSPFGLG
jgi:hypothetical protein